MPPLLWVDAPPSHAAHSIQIAVFLYLSGVQVAKDAQNQTTTKPKTRTNNMNTDRQSDNGAYSSEEERIEYGIFLASDDDYLLYDESELDAGTALFSLGRQYGNDREESDDDVTFGSSQMEELVDIVLCNQRRYMQYKTAPPHIMVESSE
ncbi:hypothetical protein PROFUN_10798 [Planoprotostelium fungivorum]|uniref:Uncharacterized protein n=1 Tax=Planoprotostelium fungivorum TaxID=1890364 RepID=A0A2P6NCW8_9EUKA|nr:hypothetical protein PROFUN_10798 [Planoprotostelium fungivorum]